ncbi:acyltransferase family protein [Lysobacter claricitrinus]|uniref:acyltransferase family protein n=1 Tax=Lysobacter claricitrinus TaxID=3367728 RepID=UPI0037DAFA4A
MPRANNFDALRLFAAFMVLWSHQFALSGRPEPLFLGPHGYGNLGVLIFFSISGYLVRASWKSDPSLWRFALKRFLRIAPALTVCALITPRVVEALGLWPFPHNPLHALNGSLWTIEFEVQCYLMLAALALLLPRVGLIFALGMLVWWWNVRDVHPHTVAHFGLLFAVGILMQEYPVLRTGKAVAGLVAAGLLLLPTGHYQVVLALIVAPLSIWIGSASWPVLRRAGRWGDISYGIYIYAWPVEQIGVALLGQRTSYLELLAMTVTATVALAVLSWRLIEKPSLSLKPRAMRPMSTVVDRPVEARAP